MLEIKWLYELMLVIYGASVVSYFIDFIQYNRKANQTAFWLLIIVWMLQTFFLLYRLIGSSDFPIWDIYDGLFFYAWILVMFSLALNWFLRIDFFVFFTNLLGFFVMVLHVSAPIQDSGLEQGIQLANELLILHISMALISYGFFTLSFILSLMYLLQYWLLKEKKGYKWLSRLGNLKKLDSLSFKSVTVGVPLLLVSMILGVTWAYKSGAEFYWYDLKTIGSFFVWLVYVCYLYLRVVRKYQGRSISWFNTCSFLFLLINFFLFGTFSNFHF